MVQTISDSIIGQFNIERIRKIIPELNRQKETKRDFIAGAPRLTIEAHGDELRLRMDGVQTFRLAKSGRTFATWVEAETNAEPGESITPIDSTGDMPLTNTALRQLCTACNLPKDTADRFAKEGQAHLAASILTERMRLPRRGVDEEKADAFGGKYLVRTLDNRCRAVLSPSYRILDSVDLFFNAYEEMEKAGAELWQMRLWDDGFQMLGVAKGISGNVTTDRTFDPGDGWDSRWANLGDDTQYAAISITNSETGGGSLNIAPAIMRRVCCNFNIWAKVFRGIHLQRARSEEGMIYSAETEAAESRTVWLKVRDAVKTVFDKEKFQAYIDRLNGAAKLALGAKVEETTMNVLKDVQIPEDRKAAILRNLLESRDYSRYGLVQAVTWQAHAEDKSGNESVAHDLEELGGDLVHMPDNQFRSMLVTA